MNLSSFSIEHLFKDKMDYIIEDVKSTSIFEPKRWTETFGRALTKNIIEAKILHASTGLELPLKRYNISKKMQVLEVAGLHSYNDKSELKKELLKEYSQELQDCFINRLDICIDFEKPPQRMFRKLNSMRKSFQFKNTTYWKTEKEKKSNSQMDIKLYNKALKERLDYSLHRLEFCFKKSYFQNKRLYELDEALLKKMEKSIYKFSGLKVKIEP